MDEAPHDDGTSMNDLITAYATNRDLLLYVDILITKVTSALLVNKEHQERVLAKQITIRAAGNHIIRKVPVQRYLPPYFKDGDQMCAPHSEEGNQRIQQTTFDPLMREEKKWSSFEITNLQKAVRFNMIEICTEEDRTKRCELQENLLRAGQSVKTKEVQQWTEELEHIIRKIRYERYNLPDVELCKKVDPKKIDWEKINNIDFNGLRRADALRLKWLNEISPRWNQGPWNEQELQRLKQLRERKKFDSWGVIANKLGTNRTTWQCFQKYHTDIYQNKKEWSREEDQRLLKLCNTLRTSNGRIQWDKVTYYMKGRKRQQVRVRYARTLDKFMKHGPWTDQEDLLLIGAVNRHGARDWSKIARAVPCRTDNQCRERWVSVMDRRLSREWSLDDDEKLVFLVSTFGLGNWKKCAEHLTERTSSQCRIRYQTIMSTKSRFYNARNHNILKYCEIDHNSTLDTKKFIEGSHLYKEWKQQQKY